MEEIENLPILVDFKFPSRSKVREDNLTLESSLEIDLMGKVVPPSELWVASSQINLLPKI